MYVFVWNEFKNANKSIAFIQNFSIKALNDVKANIYKLPVELVIIPSTRIPK
jgi:hypothetical protein